MNQCVRPQSAAMAGDITQVVVTEFSHFIARGGSCGKQ